MVIFSLEMSREQLVIRLMSSEALVDMQALRRGETGEDELIRLAETLLPLSDAKIFIDDTANISVAEIRSKCRRLKARSGLDMVVIDYLQLMKLKRRGQPRSGDIRAYQVAQDTCARAGCSDTAAFPAVEGGAQGKAHYGAPEGERLH